MSNCTKLMSLIGEFRSAGLDPERMNGEDLDIIKRVCDPLECILWLSDHTRLTSRYINAAGRRYFGLDTGSIEPFSFGAVLERTHPEDLYIIRSALKHFSIHPEEPYSMCLRMKNAEGTWRWLYMAQAPLSFSIGGLPEYLLAFICDVEELVCRSAMNGNRQIHIEKKSRYETLTQREREVLKLVAAEMTSQEIASQLFIEPSTVDTHRKNIIRKLRVKSSLGLVQYALFYAGAQSPYRRVSGDA